MVSSDSESDSEFSSSSLDDKPLSAGSKGSQSKKHRVGLGEELLFLWLEGGKCQVLLCWLLVPWDLLSLPVLVQTTGCSCARGSDPFSLESDFNGPNSWWVTPLPAALQGLPLQLGAAPGCLGARLQPTPLAFIALGSLVPF